MKILGFISRIWGIKPIYAALISLLIGSTLIPLSFMAGVAFITDPRVAVPRQVGFVSAVNWSFVYAVAFPLYVFIQFMLLAEIRQFIDRLSRWGMLVDSEGEPVSAKPIQESWQSLLKGATLAGLITATLLYLLVIMDWYLSIYVPVTTHGDFATFRTLRPDLPVDWGTAALFVDGVSPGATLAFSFWAYLVQATAIIFITFFGWFSLAFAALMEKHSRPNATVHIVPNLRTRDDHMGMHAFSRIIHYLILLYSSVFGLMYITRLWQQYLRSEFPSFMAFVRDECRTYLWPESLNDLPRVLPNFIYAGSPESYLQTATLVAALCVPVVTIVFAFLMIERVVRQGKAFVIRKLPQKLSSGVEYRSVASAAHIQQLESLPDWPLAKLQRNQLFTYMLFLIIGMFLYRLVFALLAIVLLLLLKNTMIVFDRYISSGE